MLAGISPKKLQRSTWVPDDDVKYVQSDPATGITYVSGFFESWSPNTGCGLPISTSTGLPVGVYPLINDYGENQGDGGNFTSGTAVMCSISDGAGGRYVGGQFTRIGGIERWAIAHINSDGSVDENFNAGLVDEGNSPDNSPTISKVYSILLMGGNLLVAGSFNFIGGLSRSYLAILNASTGAVDGTNFHLDGEVYVIAEGDTGIYVGGDFQNILGQPRNRLAKLDGGSNLNSFNPNINNLNSSGSIYGIHVVSGVVGVVGNFTQVGAIFRDCAAIIDATTGLATSFDPDLSNEAYSIYIDNTITYIGGTFSTVNLPTVVRNGIAAFDTTTGIVNSTWDPNAGTGDILAMQVGGAAIYVGGTFTSIGGATRRQLAALDPVGVGLGAGAATSWDPNPTRVSTVRCLLLDGTEIFVGGNFSGINAVTTGGAAALAADGQSVIPLLLATPTAVGNAILPIQYNGDTKILVAGGANFYMMDTAGNIDWTLVSNGAVQAIHQPAGNTTSVFVGGSFTTIGGQSRSKIVEVTLSDGSVGSALSSTINGSILTITSVSSDPTVLYVGGSFTTITTDPGAIVNTRNRAATLGAGLGAWNPNLNDTVYRILPTFDESALFICGDFGTINGSTIAANIVGVDLTNGTYNGYNADPQFNTKSIRLNFDGTRLYVGGDFEYTDNNGLAQGVAEVDSTTGTFFRWNPNIEEQPPEASSDGSFADIDDIDWNPFTNVISTGGGLSDVNSLPNPHFVQWLIPFQINVTGVNQTTGKYLPLTSTDISRDTAGSAIFGATGTGGQTGFRGPTGISPLGNNGATGLRGLTGLIGAQGLTGLEQTGIFGITGITGKTGISVIGETGLSGATGIQGVTGINSYVPAAGVTGIAPFALTANNYAIITTSSSLTSVTVTLPLAASIGAGKMFSIRCFANGTIIQTSGSDLINGVPSLLYRFAGNGSLISAVEIYCNGTNYFARGALPAPGGPTGLMGITGLTNALAGLQGITGVTF